MNLKKNKSKMASRVSHVKYTDLEDILNKKGLISEKSILKNIIENENVRQLAKIILAAAFISGGIIVALTAPNLIGALGRLNKSFGYKSSKDKQKSLNDVFYSLEKRRLIVKKTRDNKVFFRLTPKGRSVFIKKYFQEIKINKPEKWDRLWRVVLFDIPNNKNNERDILRDKLKRMGFFQFQKSAFIIPFPCRKELEAVLEIYGLHKYVTYIEANYVSDEDQCRRFFSL